MSQTAAETQPAPIPVDDRDGEGRVIRTGEMREGRFHGQILTYGGGSHPAMRARMQADLIHGEVRHYDSEGTLVQVAEFVHGVQQGVTTFYANARPTCRMSYRAGQQDGPSVFFHDNGTVAATFLYRAGKREGEATHHTPQGCLIRRETYANDRLHGPVVGFHDDGTLSERCTYRLGLLDGELCRFFPSGKLMQRGVYRNGLLVDALRTYAEDGREVARLQAPKIAARSP